MSVSSVVLSPLHVELLEVVTFKPLKKETFHLSWWVQNLQRSHFAITHTRR